MTSSVPLFQFVPAVEPQTDDPLIKSPIEISLVASSWFVLAQLPFAPRWHQKNFMEQASKGMSVPERTIPTLKKDDDR